MQISSVTVYFTVNILHNSSHFVISEILRILVNFSYFLIKLIFIFFFFSYFLVNVTLSILHFPLLLLKKLIFLLVA